MSQGLAIYRADGALGFSSSDVTWNQVDMFYCAGGSSAVKHYPVMIGREVLVTQVMVNPPTMARPAITHTITVSGGTVSVSGGNEAAYIIILMR